MPQPTKGDVHIDRALTNISVAYVQSESNFVSMSAFPRIPVTHRSDSYYEYGSSDFRRDEVKERAPSTESAGTGFDLTTQTYLAKEYALHHDIADSIRKNADEAVDLERAASILLTQNLLINKEINWMTDYFGTGIWGTDKVGGTDFALWDDASSDPESDIDAGRATVLKDTGLEVNTLIVSYETHQSLKRHPIIADRFKHTSADSITTDIIARFLEVERYIVAKASYVSSNEDAAVEVNAFIAGKNALLCHVAPSPGLFVPSAGYTFNWTGMTGAQGGMRVKRFRMEHLSADRIEAEIAYDHKLVMSNAGYFFSGTVS